MKAWFVLFVTLILFSENSFAIDLQAGTQVIDGIKDEFQGVIQGWGPTMVQVGTSLFWRLALLSMVWTFAIMSLQRKEIGDIFAEMIRFFATTGFFLWLLLSAQGITKSIIQSLGDVAGLATGTGTGITPATTADLGFKAFSDVYDAMDFMEPIDSAAGLVVGLIVMVIMLLIALEFLYIQIMGWFLMYGGILLLGFGGGKWTSDIAIGYYKKVLAVGIEGFGIMLIVGVGQKIIETYQSGMQQGLLLKQMVILLGMAIALWFLAHKVPKMLASIVDHRGGVGSGGNFATAAMGTAAAAMAVAASSMKAASNGLVGAAANATGGAQAMNAAWNSTSGGSGGDIVSRAGGAAKTLLSEGIVMAGNSVSNKMGGKVSSTVGAKLAEAIKDRGGKIGK